MAESSESKSGYKKFIMFVLGSFILVLGITLTLVWWDEMLMLFKGMSGFVLALAGLVLLYTIK